MTRILTFSILLIILNIQSIYSQSLGLGNIYDSDKTIPKINKEQKELRKELLIEAKQNKDALEVNLKQLQNFGYFKYIFVNNVTNDNAKFLLAIDSKLKSLQSELDSNLLALNNSDWLDSLNRPLPKIPNERSIGISFGNENKTDYNALETLKELRTRYKRAVESYKRYMSPVSSETNNKFMDDNLLSFHKNDDDARLGLLQKSLVVRKQQYEERLDEIKEINRKEKDYQKHLEEEYHLAELERQKKIEQAQERERKLETEIASLPSKASLIAKFRTYKHRTGYNLEMFPVGFIPKAGKPVTDYVTIFGRKYKGRYREVNENGMNTFIIEYYDSGSILSVTVYKGGNSIYTANYRDRAGKPYEIRSTSSDGKFYLVHKRIYNTSEDKTNLTTRYQYVPLDYWYD